MNKRNCARATGLYAMIALAFIFVIATGMGCGLFQGETSTIAIDLSGGPTVPADGTFKPGDISTYTLTISGSGTGTIEKTYRPEDDQIKLLVPSGKMRRIELEAFLPTDPVINPGPVLSYIGIAYIDLAPSEVKRLNLKMIPGRTRLLVPDLNNRRVVQINNLSEGPVTSPPNYFTISTDQIQLRADDVDLDARGKIYIPYLYYHLSDVIDYRMIMWIDAIPSTTGGYIRTLGAIDAMTVDKYNNCIYYFSNDFDSYTILRIDLNRNQTILGNIETDPLLITEQINLEAELVTDGLGIRGMDTDLDGMLYFSSYDGIVKIDPRRSAGSRVLDVSDVPEMGYPNDVMVKGLDVYVTADSENEGYSIVRLRTSDLALVQHAGSAPHTTLPIPVGQAGEFYGPQRFFATTNRKIYLIDEYTTWSAAAGYIGYNRLVGFDDLMWTNWEVRQVSNDGYRFYDNY